MERRDKTQWQGERKYINFSERRHYTEEIRLKRCGVKVWKRRVNAEKKYKVWEG